MEIRRVLCPLDFSSVSEKGMEYAKALAEKFQAQLYFLYVVEPITSMPLLGHAVQVVGEIEAEMERQAREKLEKLQQEIGLEATYEIRRGYAAQEILRTAEEKEVDVIVLGTHGREGLSHFLLGSTAEKVVRRAKCPVLTVRP